MEQYTANANNQFNPYKRKISRCNIDLKNNTWDDRRRLKLFTYYECANTKNNKIMSTHIQYTCKICMYITLKNGLEGFKLNSQ